MRSSQGFLILAALAALAPAGGAHHVSSDGEFVGGNYTVEVEGHQLGASACGDGLPFAIGGCIFTPPRWPEARVTVRDEQGAPLGFAWSGRYDGGDTCGFRGEAVGEVDVLLPAACTHIAVYPRLGALRGSITVA